MPRFQLEWDAPAPRGRARYPFSRMEVGQSFFAPAADILAIRCVRAAARYHRRMHPSWRYASRQEKHPDLGPGVRIWRLADAPLGAR